MLKLIDLKKSYKTKGGVEVKALDGVSIDFPESGMVFLLGKSGSGKSTLLNVIGGLDRVDSGEVVVKGRSSKDFSSSDFDSYRNTFIGFIFQEYNILNEFSVEQNIALALQLQNKPNDREAVNEILKQVDLEGLGKRKPNTLSGGQKQRVAIARALIKNPEIIMADEPTGSLDSNTGKQVFDTLKKLSENKLVIVVSHDREFAKLYADRIIELKDGQITSDKTRDLKEKTNSDENVSVFGDSIRIKDGKSMTDTEVTALVSAIKNSKGEVVVVADKKDLPEVKRICNIGGEVSGKFSATGKVETIEYDGKDTQFIKSKLPVSHAVKIGASGLKVKPARLVFTIFLSVVAFALFGVLSTMMMYNPVYSVAMSLENSAYGYIALNKSFTYNEQEYLVGEDGVILNSVKDNSLKTTTKKTLFGVSELEKMNENELGLNFAGVFTCGTESYKSDDIMTFESHVSNCLYPQSSNDIRIKPLYANYYKVKNLCGFTDCGEEFMENNGFKLHGRYPSAKDEIAVSDYVYNMYKDNMYEMEKFDDFLYENSGEEFKLDKKIMNLKIVGVYEIGIDAKYDKLKVEVDSNKLNDELKALREEFEALIKDSFYTLGYVSKDFYTEYSSSHNFIPLDNRFGLKASFDATSQGDSVSETYCEKIYTDNTVSRFSDNFLFFDLNGEPCEFNLGEKQVLTSVYEILNEGRLTAFCNTVKTGDNYNAGYEDFGVAAERFKDINRNFYVEDVKLILRTLFEEYEAKVGEPLPSHSKVYLKNTADDTAVVDVIGYYFIKGEKSASSFMLNRKKADSLAMGSEEKDKYLIQTDGETLNTYYKKYSSDYSLPTDARYDYIITKTDNTRKQTFFMLESAPEFASYGMTNALYKSAYENATVVNNLRLVFLLAGVVMGVLAGLMFLNFIAVSISAKRKEIGVLRAVGARAADVFKIFYAEALIIVSICFVLASVVAGFACSIINDKLAQSFVKIKLFDYNAISVIMILLVSIVVSLIATFIPVHTASKKPPVESIREL